MFVNRSIKSQPHYNWEFLGIYSNFFLFLGHKTSSDNNVVGWSRGNTCFTVVASSWIFKHLSRFFWLTHDGRHQRMSKYQHYTYINFTKLCKPWNYLKLSVMDFFWNLQATVVNGQFKSLTCSNVERMSRQPKISH